MPQTRASGTNVSCCTRTFCTNSQAERNTLSTNSASFAKKRTLRNNRRSASELGSGSILFPVPFASRNTELIGAAQFAPRHGECKKFRRSANRHQAEQDAKWSFSQPRTRRRIQTHGHCECRWRRAAKIRPASPESTCARCVRLHPSNTNCPAGEHGHGALEGPTARRNHCGGSTIRRF